MNTTGEGKDLPLTRYAIEKASQQDRLSYGALVADLISRSPMSQKDLAEAAGVSARTIRNIVQGRVAPQADNLTALLIALDIDIDGFEDADVRSYTKMLAPVIRRIHPDHRTEAVSDAIGLLSDAALRNPFHSAPSNVIEGRFGVGAISEDLRGVARPADGEPTDEQ